MRWWSRCMSMVIAKTASRNVAFKVARMRESIMEDQDEFIIRRSDGEEVIVRGSRLKRLPATQPWLSGGDEAYFPLHCALNAVGGRGGARHRRSWRAQRGFSRPPIASRECYLAGERESKRLSLSPHSLCSLRRFHQRKRKKKKKTCCCWLPHTDTLLLLAAKIFHLSLAFLSLPFMHCYWLFTHQKYHTTKLLLKKLSKK